MKNSSVVRCAVSLALILGAMSVLGGCNSAPSKPQSIASPERVQEIVKMRQIFDEVQGNWESLSADKRAEYVRMAGDEEKAKTMWDRMKNPGPSMPSR